MFLPHESNNHKPKIFHNSSLLLIKTTLILIQVFLFIGTRITTGGILGYAANISPSEVIRLTNERRVQIGLEPLVENKILSQAALAKGTHMLNNDYWAHVAPDGTQPWVFFVNAGYSYRYAGENLARDFSNPSSVVEAWIASPTHKENLLSSRYKEIGIGVVEGDLAGVDTTLVVQFFGTKYVDVVSEPIAQAPEPTLSPGEVLNEVNSPTLEPVAISEPVESPPPTPLAEVLVSPFNTSKGISLAVVGVLLAVLVIDATITRRRRIRRIGGRTFAHIAYLGMILAIILILKAGQIL